MSYGNCSQHLFWIFDSIGKTVAPFLRQLGLKTSTDLAPYNDVQAIQDGKGSRKSIMILKISDHSNPKKRIEVVFNDDERLPSKEVSNYCSSPPAIPVDFFFSCKLLLSDHAYVVDAETEIFVWVGSSSSTACRKLAILLAKRILCEDSRSPSTSFTKVLENTETVLFKV